MVRYFGEIGAVNYEDRTNNKHLIEEEIVN